MIATAGFSEWSGLRGEKEESWTKVSAGVTRKTGKKKGEKKWKVRPKTGLTKGGNAGPAKQGHSLWNWVKLAREKEGSTPWAKKVGFFGPVPEEKKKTEDSRPKKKEDDEEQ